MSNFYPTPTAMFIGYRTRDGFDNTRTCIAILNTSTMIRLYNSMTTHLPIYDHRLLGVRHGSIWICMVYGYGFLGSPSSLLSTGRIQRSNKRNPWRGASCSTPLSALVHLRRFNHLTKFCRALQPTRSYRSHLPNTPPW